MDTPDREAAEPCYWVASVRDEGTVLVSEGVPIPFLFETRALALSMACRHLGDRGHAIAVRPLELEALAAHLRSGIVKSYAARAPAPPPSPLYVPLVPTVIDRACAAYACASIEAGDMDRLARSRSERTGLDVSRGAVIQLVVLNLHAELTKLASLGFTLTETTPEA